MDIVITPSVLSGIVDAIPSKSQAHRLLICAAFADKETTIFCTQTNEDIESTARCLRSLGAGITRTADGFVVDPITDFPGKADLYCAESGSTLRFLLPIAGAMGVDTTFHLEGRLPMRPLSPLWEEMERMGCSLSRPTDTTVRCTGKLRGGNYSIPGNISSQYVTGLMLALPLIREHSTLTILGKLESAPYINLTKACLEQFGVYVDCMKFHHCVPYRSPGRVIVEGDWSNAAFFLAAKHLGCSVDVRGLNKATTQGDLAIINCLDQLQRHTTISGADIPDLIPVLAVYAACNHGCVFTDVGRLRLKESDRIIAITEMLNSLGCKTAIQEDCLIVHPAKFTGGTVDSANDHRIAMAAAIAAIKATGPVTIIDAQCVKKSYPAFWDVYKELGGIYE